MPANLERLVFEALRDGADEQSVVALLKALSKEDKESKCSRRKPTKHHTRSTT
jgi:hypothetical protein